MDFYLGTGAAMRLWLAVVVAIWVAAAAARPAWAERVVGEVVTVGIGGTRTGGAGTYRRGCWVPVRVKLESRSGVNEEVMLGVVQPDLDRDKVLNLSQKHTVTPGEMTGHEAWVYYWPRIDDQSKDLVPIQVLDASSRKVLTTLHPSGTPTGLERSGGEDGNGQRWVVTVGESDTPEGRWDVGLGSYAGSHGGTQTVRFSNVVYGSDLPDRAIGLDGVDVIVLEADHMDFTKLPAEGQQQALMEWVRAGGHLVITVGSKLRAVKDPTLPLSKLVPLKLPEDGRASSREITDVTSLRVWMRGGAKLKGPLVQAVGVPEEGARVLAPAAGGKGSSAEPPLVVAWNYGAGVVTVVTVDLASPPMAKGLDAKDWFSVWQQTGLWKGNVATKEAVEGKTVGALSPVTLDSGVGKSIDFSSQTAIGLMLAVLFLGGYWIVAGPGGHMVLRFYGRTHWSWWIFGGVVLLASVVAVMAATLLRLQKTDVRHRTFVMGQVNSPEASVVAYYGVYAPQDGRVRLELPEATGMSYLTPFHDPTGVEPLSFPDPQQYELHNAEPGVLETPFRNTLKKVQARWVGSWGGSSAGMVKGRDLQVVVRMRPDRYDDLYLAGELTNETGYDLHDVRIAATSTLMQMGVNGGQLFTVGDWRDGESLDLARRTSRREHTKVEFGRTIRIGADTLEDVVSAVTRRYPHDPDAASSVTPIHGIGGGGGHDDDHYFVQGEENNEALLEALGDWRDPGWYSETERVALSRHLTRVVDRSLALRTGGMLIMAKAGVVGKDGVRSPVQLKVNGKLVEGKGEVLFLWTACVKESRAGGQ